MTSDPYPSINHVAVVPHGESRQLVLVLHGAWGLPHLLVEVRAAVEWILPDADMLAPHYLSGMFARCPGERLIKDLLALLDEAIEHKAATGTPYEEVLLIGYSLGACLCFRIAADWGDRRVPITRLVSLAGTNFGWSLWPTPPNMLPVLRFLTRTSMMFMASIGIAVTVRTLQYNRPFCKHLREHWRKRLRESEPLPWIVFITGDVDEFVAPWMLEDFRAQQRARIWTIPHTQHLTLLLMDDTPLGRERQLALKLALTADLTTEDYDPDPALISGGTQPDESGPVSSASISA